MTASGRAVLNWLRGYSMLLADYIEAAVALGKLRTKAAKLSPRF